MERRTCVCVLPPTERKREKDESRSFDGTPSPLTDYSREPLDPSSLSLSPREDLTTRLTRGFLLPTLSVIIFTDQLSSSPSLLR